MAEQHELIMKHGLEAALSEARCPRERANLKIAAEILADQIEEPNASAYLHSVFCTIFLPHRRTAPDQVWQRSNGVGATLMIQPTKDENETYAGVPFGSTGRLMLIYLQNEAFLNRSRRVELGRSMHAWLRSMGIDSGGRGYRAAREQAQRIERCLISVVYDGRSGRERWQDTIIRGSFNLGDAHQPDLFPQYVELSEMFYNNLLSHPATLYEPALRKLAGKSLALDVYVWLSYRLHALKQPTKVSWGALQAAFGPNYERVRDFRGRFGSALEDALLVYPQARVSLSLEGLLLEQSDPPAAPRTSFFMGNRKRTPLHLAVVND